MDALKTGDPAQEIAEEELKLARAVIQSFLQSLKAFQLYEDDHPILHKFRDRLEQDFDRYFEKHDSFIIQVDELQFSFQGKALHEEQALRENLAFMFFKDGIREIRFFRGLELNEIVDFLNIVRKSSVVSRMEDDLVTLLWGKDFLHIDFSIVEEFFEGEGILIPLTEEDLVKGLEYRGFGEGGGDQDDKKAPSELGAGAGSGAGLGVGTGFGPGVGSGTAIGEPRSLIVEGLKPVPSLSTDQSLTQACALTPDEIEEIYRRALKEEQLENVYILINNFTEILLHLGEDTETYENIVSYFDRVIKSLLEQGEIIRVVTIFKNLHDTMIRMPLKEKQTDTIHRILQVSSDPRSIELLGKVMQRDREIDRESITQYLEFVGRDGIEPLCFLLGVLDVDRWRRAVRERLVEVCKEGVGPLVKFLSESKASFVSDLLYIFGKVKDPSTLKYLTNLVDYEHLKVREEVLKLATEFQGKDLVKKFLRDPTPEIRGKAAVNFSKIGKSQSFRSLAKIILSEDFHTRSYGEKTSFFKALGETGSKEAIPLLEEIINKKRWLKKAQWEEMRLCAVNTLKRMKASKE